jgi:hypothetical protein
LRDYYKRFTAKLSEDEDQSEEDEPKRTTPTAILCGLLVPALAGAEEVFHYRFQTKDGRQFQYVFESSTDSSPRSITKEEATRIAANWVPTFYHLQLGSIEYAEFYEKPLPHWLVCFADTVSGPIQTPAFRRGVAGRQNCSTELFGEVVIFL